VDIGAYEFQNPASIISYAWLQHYGLATDGSADSIDSDHDGMNNWQEWIAGTDPLDPTSVLKMLAPAPRDGGGVAVSWLSVSNRNYFLQCSTNLFGHTAFSTIQTNIPGQTGVTTATETNIYDAGLVVYRIGVQQ